MHVFSLVMSRLTTAHRHEVAQRCAHYNLKRATRAVTRLYEAALGDVGLTITQFTLLIAASMAGPVAMGHLAEELVMDRTTLSRNLRPLGARGLVVVDPGEHDHRARIISVTDEGERLLARAHPRWRVAQDRVVATFGDTPYDAFLASVRTFLEMPE